MHSKLVSAAALYALVGLATAMPHGTIIKRVPQDYGAPTGDDSGSDGMQGWEKDVLDMHNDERSQCGQEPLKWNPDLAKKADENASQCVFKHTDGDISGAGENIAQGTTGAYGGGDLCKLWADEKNGGGEDGHYTQMVWKDTVEVGCSLRECGGNNYLVCQYFPAGNVQGQEGSNVCSGGPPSNPGDSFPGGGKSPAGGKKSPVGGGKPSGPSKPSQRKPKPSGGNKKPEDRDTDSQNDSKKKPQKPEEPCDDDNDKKGGHEFVAPSKKPSDDNDRKFYGKKSDDDDERKFYGKKQSDDDDLEASHGNRKSSDDNDKPSFGGDRSQRKSSGGEKGGNEEPCDD